MQYRVRELDGALLDAAVAKAEGYELDADGDSRTIRENGGAPSTWHPSIDWGRGGPIIKRESIFLSPQTAGRGGRAREWFAEIRYADERADSDGFYEDEGGVSCYAGYTAYGKTPLIAAMRAYVASKYGEFVEI